MAQPPQLQNNNPPDGGFFVRITVINKSLNQSSEFKVQSSNIEKKQNIRHPRWAMAPDLRLGDGLFFYFAKLLFI